MPYIYRYTDLKDNIIKYVGIVWSESRSLKQRIMEHKKNDDWCKNGSWKIEYLYCNNRTTAEAIESHLIALYGTNSWYNKSKSNWGECIYFPDFEENFIEYNQDKISSNLGKKKIRKNKTTKISKNFIKVSSANPEFEIIKGKFNISSYQQNFGDLSFITIRESDSKELYEKVKHLIG